MHDKSEIKPTRKKTQMKSFPPVVTRLLCRLVLEHSREANAYRLRRGNARHIAMATGLSSKQIHTWLAHARHRHAGSALRPFLEKHAYCYNHKRRIPKRDERALLAHENAIDIAEALLTVAIMRQYQSAVADLQSLFATTDDDDGYCSAAAE